MLALIVSLSVLDAGSEKAGIYFRHGLEMLMGWIMMAASVQYDVMAITTVTPGI